MTPEEIDQLIERAGLSNIIDVFNRAVEINPHERDTQGRLGYDGYGALAALIRAAIDTAVNDAQIKIARAYLDGAATEREACARVAETYLKKPYADGRLIDVGELQAVTHIAAAIRARGEG